MATPLPYASHPPYIGYMTLHAQECGHKTIRYRTGVSKSVRTMFLLAQTDGLRFEHHPQARQGGALSQVLLLRSSNVSAGSTRPRRAGQSRKADSPHTPAPRARAIAARLQQKSTTEAVVRGRWRERLLRAAERSPGALPPVLAASASARSLSAERVIGGGCKAPSRYPFLAREACGFAPSSADARISAIVRR